MKNLTSYFLLTSCCAALLVILATPVAAASLQGSIAYRASGTTKPVPLALGLVRVHNTATRQVTITKTNSLGGYLFKSLPSGLYVIVVEMSGRRIYQGKVQVREPAIRFDIPL
jgi:hypothetical protein